MLFQSMLFVDPLGLNISKQPFFVRSHLATPSAFFCSRKFVVVTHLDFVPIIFGNLYTSEVPGALKFPRLNFSFSILSLSQIVRCY